MAYLWMTSFCCGYAALGSSSSVAKILLTGLPFPFVLIHPFVSLVDTFIDIEFEIIKTGSTSTSGHSIRMGTIFVGIPAGNCLLNAVYVVQHLIFLDANQQYGEFITPGAEYKICTPGNLAKKRGELYEIVIADQVSAIIIYLFEMIQIEHDKSQKDAVHALAAFHLLIDDVVKAGAVQESSQRIGVGFAM